MALGSLLLQKHLGCSDRELVEQITENPYSQYFIGLPGYQIEPSFVPSLLLEFRKRLTEEILGDKIYRNRKNLAYCKSRGIRLSGPALERPKKEPNSDKKIEVERAFSLAKRSFGLGSITTKLETTTRSSIVLLIIAMNVERMAKAASRILLSIFQGANIRLDFEPLLLMVVC